MKTIDVKGAIVPNEDKWIYEYFEMDATCPADIKKGLQEAEGDEVTIVINSPGGEISSGSEMWYMINGYENRTYADIVGYACSAASYVAMGADIVRMSPSALLMIHCVSSGAHGDHNVLEKEAGTLKVADKAVSNIYRLKTGMSNEEIISLMESETWMDAERAKELGFIDEIINQKEKGKGTVFLQNSFGEILSEGTKEAIRHLVKHPDKGGQDFTLQTRLNLLKLGGVRDEV